MIRSSKVLLFTLILTFTLPCFAFAHGGKTDSKGGHRDNYNASGLGSYHYHCDGHPAHLHTDGICPYSSSNSSTQSISQKLRTEMENKGYTVAESEFNSAGRKNISDTYISKSNQLAAEKEPSLFQDKSFIACILFVAAYIIALLYRIFVSKELYYFPFALSLLSLLAMVICFFAKTPAMYAAGIVAIINLFCEK